VRLLHRADAAATYTPTAFSRRSICAREVSSSGANLYIGATRGRLGTD
jgi:hypothetical protein